MEHEFEKDEQEVDNIINGFAPLPDENIISLAKKIIDQNEKYKNDSRLLNELKDERTETQEELYLSLTSIALTGINVNYNGKNFNVHTKTDRYVSLADNKIAEPMYLTTSDGAQILELNVDKGVLWLIEQGLSHILNVSANSRSLTSVLKTMADEHEASNEEFEIPEELFNVNEKKRIGTRRGKTR